MECDGTSRAISTCLTALEIPHETAVGFLRLADGRQCRPHYWVRLPDGHILDIRARMWLGADSLVPHGIFMPAKGVEYVQDAQDHMTFSHVLFGLMTGLDLDAVLEQANPDR